MKPSWSGKKYSCHQYFVGSFGRTLTKTPKKHMQQHRGLGLRGGNSGTGFFIETYFTRVFQSYWLTYLYDF